LNNIEEPSKSVVTALRYSKSVVTLSWNFTLANKKCLLNT